MKIFGNGATAEDQTNQGKETGDAHLNLLFAFILRPLTIVVCICIVKWVS
jgi:hypothetical protein